jgi:SAM-dependent methyltransferase
MGAEHRGRYWWAGQLLGGKKVLDAGCGTGYGLEILAEAGAASVTGVDVDTGAVAESRTRGESCGAVVVQADLQALALPDDSFDAAVCFETIEHLESPQRGLAELRRVVRPGGMIVVSSPNPDVYPPGNEHHQHELRPDELLGLVQEHFGCVQTYLQHAWLASAIEPAENGANGHSNGSGASPLPVRRSAPARPGGTTFTIVIGCDEEAPRPPALVSMTDPFEVRWWQERVEAAETRSADAEAEATRALEAERRAAEAEARVASLVERLEQVNKSLIDANQELAQMPLLKHRLAEMHELKAALDAELEEVLGSRSWQATGFLRKASRALKLQR